MKERFYIDGVAYEDVEGNGDVNTTCPDGLMNCTPPKIRTWRAEDACGNVTEVTITVEINDDIRPVLSELSEDVTV